MDEPVRLRQSSSEGVKRLLESTDAITLSAQARRRITESSVEAARAPRITAWLPAPLTRKGILLAVAAAASVATAGQIQKYVVYLDTESSHPSAPVTRVQEVPRPEAPAPEPEEPLEAEPEPELLPRAPKSQPRRVAVSRRPAAAAVQTTPSSAASRDEPVESPLSQELRLLKQARAALAAGDTEQTLRLLRRHRLHFPQSQLLPERIRLESEIEKAASTKKAASVVP